MRWLKLFQNLDSLPVGHKKAFQFSKLEGFLVVAPTGIEPASKV
jgi:hypothetical protein